MFFFLWWQQSIGKMWGKHCFISINCGCGLGFWAMGSVMLFQFFLFLFITIPIFFFFFWIRSVRVEGHGVICRALFAQGRACHTITYNLLSLAGYGYQWVRHSWNCGWLHKSEWSFLSWESGFSNLILLEGWGIISHIHLSWFWKFFNVMPSNYCSFLCLGTLGHFANDEGLGLEGKNCWKRDWQWPVSLLYNHTPFSLGKEKVLFPFPMDYTWKFGCFCLSLRYVCPSTYAWSYQHLSYLPVDYVRSMQRESYNLVPGDKTFFWKNICGVLYCFWRVVGNQSKPCQALL